MICYLKEIQGLLSTLTKKTAVFQGFQGLEKTVMNFKYFQALQGPVQTLHMAECLLRLSTIEINSAIANNLKPIGMIKMLCVAIYPNIYQCASDYMQIYHDRF